MALTEEQIEQYSRQIILPELGGVGQKRLLAARALLTGPGIAFECAATYLVGAGLGSIDHEGVADRVGFAHLTERNLDVSLAPAPSSVDLGEYDVLLSFADPIATTLHGHARRGEIRTLADEHGIHIDVVPATVGCLACGAAPSCEPAAPREIDALQAGAMAALVALLLAAEIRPEPVAKRLSLAHDAPTWSETPPGPTASCSRPCRP